MGFKIWLINQLGGFTREEVDDYCKNYSQLCDSYQKKVEAQEELIKNQKELIEYQDSYINRLREQIMKEGE